MVTDEFVAHSPFAADSESAKMHHEASRWAPLGVQGDARYYAPFPIYMTRARGARLYDVDENEYIDYWAAAGPIILGHTYKPLVHALQETLEHEGTLFCLPHPQETQLARKICEMVPSAEKVVFGCGGSDVLFFAIRGARAYTGRDKLVKFEGGYHGWNDAALVSVRPPADKAGPSDAPHSVASSAGIPNSVVEDVYVLPYNDIPATERLLSKVGHECAALLVEPILHTQGCILPEPGFLEYLREACTRYGIVLIFDEIITGFRHSLGGAQKLFNVTPDLTALGKAMANGFPISALAGKREFMSIFAPEGPAYYSGTFMGQIINVTASLKTIEALESGEVHRHIESLGAMMGEGINEIAQRYGVRMRCQHFGSVWTVYFTDTPVRNYRDVLALGFPKSAADVAFRRHLIAHGIYHHPPTTRAYLYAAHTVDDVQRTLDVVEDFVRENRDTLS